MFARLRELEATGREISVALVGAGFVGRGLVHQIGLTPGMRVGLIVNRTPERAVAAFAASGHEPSSVVVTDDLDALNRAVAEKLPAVCTDPALLAPVVGIEAVVEATGDVGHGAQVALLAIAGGKHLVSMNYETDATVGPLLNQLAFREGVVYSGSDGDQPGVMKRLFEYVEGIGLDVVAAVNCKGFLDVHATPETIKPWADKQNTSLKMTTAFTDGTKMNVENASVANATGLVPDKRGMHGVQTTLAEALDDFKAVIEAPGVVDFTLGGDFGSGVFVIGSGADPELMAPYLQYLKMGPGPWYLFFRPWHLVHFEAPLSIAEAVLDGVPTIAPAGAAGAEVVTLAKRDLPAGTSLDGIGGFDCYGLIDRADRARGLLPIGLAEGAELNHAVSTDTPIDLDDVTLAESPLKSLRSAQEAFFAGDDTASAGSLAEMWNGQP